MHPSDRPQNGLESLGVAHLRKSLGQSVFENLKQAIINGDVAAGSRIVESRLALRLDISRTPVREGLHKLEREGYVAKLPKGGFVVLRLTRDDIEETFGIRIVLESYAAKLAARKHRESEIDSLEKQIVEFQTCLENNDLEALPSINTTFHDRLYGLSRSPRLIKMINDLRDPMYRFRRMILKSRRMAEMSNTDHQHMLQFLKRRDAAGVEKVVREHLRRGKAAVLKTYDAADAE